MVSTLQFTVQAVRKSTHLKYYYSDYFTVICTHTSIANKWRENEQLHDILLSVIHIFKLIFPYLITEGCDRRTDGRMDRETRLCL